MADEIRRAKLKKAALMRATFNARVALERIDFKLDEIDPALEELDNASLKELPAYEVKK